LIKIKSNKVIIKYLYYYLTITAKKYVKSGSGNPKLMSNVISNIKIPIPQIEIQTKIVEILDHFNKLCNDILERIPAEIKMRQEQYEYYRNKLLTFS
jgi:type I restriction enzyme S subunit